MSTFFLSELPINMYKEEDSIIYDKTMVLNLHIE